MTLFDFKKANRKDMVTAIYQDDKIYPVISVDEEEELVEIEVGPEDKTRWVRPENIKSFIPF